MSRWIDADTLRSKLMQYIGLTNGFDRAFSEAPSIDIVRCGECEHRGADYCYKHSHRVTDSDFCSYGERKEKACTFENDTEIKSCSKDSDLISRADAIEALGEEPPVWCDEDYEIAERDQWRTDIEAIKSVPSADRPKGEWTLLTEERPVDDYEIIATAYWPEYGDSTIAVGHIDRFDKWHLYSPTEGELIKGFEVIAWMPLPEPYKGEDE